jgi:hypothetical protein
MKIEVSTITDITSHIPCLNRRLSTLENGNTMRAGEVPATCLMELVSVSVAVIDRRGERRK